MSRCLLVIDAQESFRQRPYWDEALAVPYLAAQNALIAYAQAQAILIVRVFHCAGPHEQGNPFALESGLVRPLNGLAEFEAAAVFTKTRHSALVGTGLDVWLIEHGIRHVLVSGIRTEQCCETTARHASDEGWQVDFALDATLTFSMTQPDGSLLSAQELRMRTATVLQDRFAQVRSVAQIVAAERPVR